MDVNRRGIGGKYEELAAAYLKEQGFQVIEQNYHCRMGEIDLIAREHEYLVFVEVKYRENQKGGGPLAAVNYRKQRRISRVARYYLVTKLHTVDIPCRFDVVGITPDGIEHLRAAFDYKE